MNKNKNYHYTLIITRIVIPFYSCFSLHASQQQAPQQQINTYNARIGKALGVKVENTEQGIEILQQLRGQIEQLKSAFGAQNVDQIIKNINTLQKKYQESSATLKARQEELQQLNNTNAPIFNNIQASMWKELDRNVNIMQKFFGTIDSSQQIKTLVQQYQNLDKNVTNIKTAQNIHKQLYPLFLQEIQKERARLEQQKILQDQAQQYTQAINTLLQTAGLQNLDQLDQITQTLTSAHALLGKNPEEFETTQKNIESAIATQTQEIQKIEQSIQTSRTQMEQFNHTYIDMLIDTIVIHAQVHEAATRTVLQSQKIALPTSADQQKEAIKNSISTLDLNAQKELLIHIINAINTQTAGAT